MAKKTDDESLFLFVDPPDGFEPQEHSPAMRDTSASVFQQIKEEGLLNKMRWAVYQELYFHGPLTGSELDERMRLKKGRNHEHKRLSELKRAGVAREVGKRKCSVTGRNVYEWDVTSNLPIEEEKNNIPQRYVIVTHGGDEDFFYHLVSPEIWQAFLTRLGNENEYSTEAVLDKLLHDLYGDDYETVFDNDSINTEAIVFLECKDLCDWCQENNVKIIGGRN